MATSNFNMEDPAVQEKIRRGPHEYIPTAGKHGMYKAIGERPGMPGVSPYKAYPKMMGRFPKPEQKDFLKVNGVAIPGDIALQNFQAAMVEWDRAMLATVVNSQAEEQDWLKKNG